MRYRNMSHYRMALAVNDLGSSGHESITSDPHTSNVSIFVVSIPEPALAGL